MASNSEAHDTTTEQALRDVYDAAWGKRNEESKFYEQVVVPVPASSCSPSNVYTAKFLRLGGIQYFTQLVREENVIVIAAVNHAKDRYAARSSGSSVIVGQTGVGKSMCLRLALVERLLDRKQTIYLDEAAHVFAVYTASGCRIFRTVDPKGTLCDLSTGRAWRHLLDWAVIAAHAADPDRVAADILLSDRLTTAALIDSDPARPHPPLWIASTGAGWVSVQATSTPPLDYQGNNSWAHEEMADTIWMDVWSWPEVYAACVHLYAFDAERLERVREVFVYATPTLEHCVEFSQSPSVVHMLRDWVRGRAKSFVASPTGFRVSRMLLRQSEDVSSVYWAGVAKLTVHATWLYGVLDPNCRDNHRGRATSAVTRRVVKPYIMCPRPCHRAGSIALRSAAQVQIAGDDGREAIRLALAEVDDIREQRLFVPAYSASLSVVERSQLLV